MNHSRFAGALRLVSAEIRHRLRHSQKYQELPFEALQSCLETLECEPGLYVEKQLSRIQKCGFNRSIASEVEKVTAVSWTEGPTFLCQLRNAMVLGGEIFVANERFLMSRVSPHRALTQPLIEFEEAYLPNSLQGLSYFGHWLGDDCPAFEYFDPYAQIISLRRPTWRDSSSYEDAFEQVWNELDAFVAEKLIVIRELKFNRDKLVRINRLRERLRVKYRANPGIVYLARGPSGKQRSPKNEPDLIDFLDAAGVRIVFPEIGGEEVISQCMDADAIITVEGSQACHAIYTLRKGGALLIIQPPDRFYNPHVEWTRLLGMRYGIVVGVPLADEFRVEAGEVMQMLSLLRVI